MFATAGATAGRLEPLVSRNIADETNYYVVPTPSLRYWRTQRALFQEQLAKVAGVGVMTIIRGEAGRQLRLDVIGKLAAALDITPADLQRQPPE